MEIPITHKYIDALLGTENNLIMAPAGNLGINRHDMPQIDSKYRSEFVEFMKSRGVKVRNIRVPVNSLKMAQGEYSRDKAGAIMANGRIGGDPIFISEDGFVVDGNHRFIAHLNTPSAGKYINTTELCMDIRNLLVLIKTFSKVRHRNHNDKVS